MRLRRFALALIVALGAVTGIAAVTGSTPAWAVSHEYCSSIQQDGTGGHCMNNWNNNGHVAVGEPGWPNSNFDGEALYRCPIPGNQLTYYVTATCPFNDTALDRQFQGDLMIQYTYNEGANGCLGTDPLNGGAYITTCNDQVGGTGGGTGTLYILYKGQHVPYGCYTGADNFAVSRYWSDYYGTEVDLMTNNVDGSYLSFQNSGNPTCWVSQAH